MSDTGINTGVRPKDLALSLPSPNPHAALPPRPRVTHDRLNFVRVGPDDLETLVAWLTTDTWPFHGRTRPTAEHVQAAAAEGAYWGNENRAFWVIVDEASRVGLLRLEDLQDNSPTTDFRVRTLYRGRGIGTEMVRFAADHLFPAFPNKLRLEGQTRVDNLGMRRSFRRAGWVPEAYYRQAWPAEDGTIHDAVGYAIVRDDWANGTTTSVPWPIE